MSDYIPPKECERRLGLANGTLAVQRCRGTSTIPFVRIGRSIRYHWPTVVEVLARNTVSRGG